MKKRLRFSTSPFGASSLFPVFSLLMLLAAPGSILAQKYFTAEKSFVLKLGTTLPLYESISIGPTDSLKLKERKANKPKFIPNFAGRRPLDFHSPEALPNGDVLKRSLFFISQSYAKKDHSTLTTYPVYQPSG